MVRGFHKIPFSPNLEKFVTNISANEYICVIFTGKINKFSKPDVIGRNGFSSRNNKIYKTPSDNIKTCKSIHAEEDAIIRYKKKNGRYGKRKPINLFIGRANFKNGRPCWNCYQMLVRTTKENYNISNIYYTNDSTSEIVKTNLTNIITGPFKVTPFWLINFDMHQSGVNIEIGENNKILVFVK